MKKKISDTSLYQIPMQRVKVEASDNKDFLYQSPYTSSRYDYVKYEQKAPTPTTQNIEKQEYDQPVKNTSLTVCQQEHCTQESVQHSSLFYRKY